MRLCWDARRGHSRGRPRLAAVSVSGCCDRNDRLWRALSAFLVENVWGCANPNWAFAMFCSWCEEFLDTMWLFAICILFSGTFSLSLSLSRLFFMHLFSLSCKWGQGRTENGFELAQKIGWPYGPLLWSTAANGAKKEKSVSYYFTSWWKSFSPKRCLNASNAPRKLRLKKRRTRSISSPSPNRKKFTFD